MSYEVPEPILNSPYEEPREYWRLEEGREPERAPGRRPPMYYYRPPGASAEEAPSDVVGTAIKLKITKGCALEIPGRGSSASERGYG